MGVTIQGINLKSSKFLSNKKLNKTDMISSNPQRTQNNTLTDSNYGIVIAKKNVSFKGGIFTPELAKPLSEKISYYLAKLASDDLLVVGKDIKSSVAALKNNMTDIPTMVDQMIIISEPHLDSTLAFFKKPEQKFCTAKNIGSKAVTLVDCTGIDAKLAVKTDALFALGDKLMFNKVPVEYMNGVENFAIDNPKTVQIVNFSSFVPANIAMWNFSNHNRLERNLGLIKVPKAKTAKAPVPANAMPNSAKQVPAYISTSISKLTFADVGGADDAIVKLNKGVVFPMLYPEAFKKQISHGKVLVGPPGTGKTCLGRAIANEVEAPYYELKGSELIKQWVGEPEAKMTEFLNMVDKNDRCVVFIDEADMILKNRSSIEGKNHINVTNVLLPYLTEVEKSNKNIFFILATNNFDVLDPALVRYGRIGGFINVGVPDLKGCKQIFGIHLKDVKICGDFDIDAFSREFHKNKFVGSDIAEVVVRANENTYNRLDIYAKMAARTFTKEDIKDISAISDDFEKALKSVIEEKIEKEGKADKVLRGFGLAMDANTDVVPFPQKESIAARVNQ